MPKMVNPKTGTEKNIPERKVRLYERRGWQKQTQDVKMNFRNEREAGQTEASAEEGGY